MDLGLEKRVALVTGASRGLGRAVAERLAREGARVALNARTSDTLEATAAKIARDTGAETLALAGDVRGEDAPRSLIQACLDRWGRFDILVANAGGPPAGEIDDLEAKSYLEALELNLLSTIHLTRAALPAMRRNGWGRVIAITSVSVKQPVPGLLLSNVARPGVIGFIKSIARDLAPEGILCNAVAPGYIATDRVEELVAGAADARGVSLDEVRSGLTADIPMGRLGQPGEFADAVAFLASERASYITGHTLQVDGGYVRGLL
jgi:3-oxoacyl-[acyl-carrier protein] reductase